MTAAADPGPSSRAPLRVLFIEDSADDAELETAELQRAGYDVQARLVATPGDLAAALTEGWDLVVCDYSMPQLGAMEALGMVRAADEDVPFLIVSGSVGEDIAVAAMRSGAQDYLLKGKLARLGAAVERELRESRVRREKRAAVAELQKAYAEQSRLVNDLEGALRFRDEFLTVASHELKTPITALVLQMHRLQRALGHVSQQSTEGQTAAALLPALDRQTRRLTDLVNSVLDVTRLQSGSLELAPGPCDLADLVREAIAPFADLQRSLGGTMELVADDALPCQCDGARLQQAVGQLVSNAVKYGGGKPVRVTLRRAGDRAHIEVHDEGIGVAPEDQARIFERFQRAVGEGPFWGMGMGLWITRRIIEAMHGTVELKSMPGAGSTFVIDLPLGH